MDNWLILIKNWFSGNYNIHHVVLFRLHYFDKFSSRLTYLYVLSTLSAWIPSVNVLIFKNVRIIFSFNWSFKELILVLHWNLLWHYVEIGSCISNNCCTFWICVCCSFDRSHVLTWLIYFYSKWAFINNRNFGRCP